MELLFDTADLDVLERSLSVYPVSGVTTNPTIIRKAKIEAFFPHLLKMKEMVGERSLHVQVVGTEREAIEKDARRIWEVLGKETFVKIPVTREGLAATKALKAEERDAHITATAIYTTLQGELALMSGADYLAVYYNRMLNNAIDPEKVISSLACSIRESGSSCKILAASFHNVAQVTEAYRAGAQACTVDPLLLDQGLAMPSIGKAVDDFSHDWEIMYGNVSLSEMR